MALSAVAAQQEIDRLLIVEQEERAAARLAADAQIRDRHFMRAERCADKAWSLQEAFDLPYRASGLWAA